jgi:phospholipid/cholesterol/gamma-HCH transport system ATP-binding protein
MQKRVGIARAIAADPSILFFDEPTAGLDPLMAAVINRLIRKIVEKSRVTAVTITHDMETVRTVSDKVYVLKDGNIHWEGKTLEIENSGNDYVERFIHGHVEE